jgi:hypothetical protein
MRQRGDGAAPRGSSRGSASVAETTASGRRLCGSRRAAASAAGCSPGERGVALLEVLAALAIFAAAAVSAVGLLAQDAELERRAEAAERRVADEERLLTAMTLLTRDDMDRRLGRRSAGPYVVETQRPERLIYRVTVGLADAPDSPDLATLLYRPEPVR